MKDKDQRLLWESYSTHRSEITEAAGDGGAEARYDEPYRKAERAKFDDPAHRQLQQRMQADDDVDNLLESLPVGASEIMYNLVSKILDQRASDAGEAIDHLFGLLEDKMEAETKSKQPTGEEGPTPGSQEHFDQMDVDDPNHWQNSGGRPPGY
jgi:hypothetical protein